MYKLGKILVTILGCGSSIGVPSLGNNWGIVIQKIQKIGAGGVHF